MAAIPSSLQDRIEELSRFAQGLDSPQEAAASLGAGAAGGGRGLAALEEKRAKFRELASQHVDSPASKALASAAASSSRTAAVPLPIKASLSAYSAASTVSSASNSIGSLSVASAPAPATTATPAQLPSPAPSSTAPPPPQQPAVAVAVTTRPPSPSAAVQAQDQTDRIHVHHLVDTIRSYDRELQHFLDPPKSAQLPKFEQGPFLMAPPDGVKVAVREVIGFHEGILAGLASRIRSLVSQVARLKEPPRDGGDGGARLLELEVELEMALQRAQAAETEAREARAQVAALREPQHDHLDDAAAAAAAAGGEQHPRDPQALKEAFLLARQQVKERDEKIAELERALYPPPPQGPRPSGLVKRGSALGPTRSSAVADVELDEARRALAEANQRGSALEARLAEQRDKIRLLVMEKDRLETELQGLQDYAGGAAQRSAADFSALEAARLRAEERSARLELELAQAAQEREALRNSYRGMEGFVQTSTHQELALRQEAEALAGRLRSEAEVGRQLRAELAEAKAQVGQLHEQCREYAAKLRAATHGAASPASFHGNPLNQSHHSELQGLVQDARGEMERARAREEALLVEAQRSASRVGALESQLESLQLQLAQAREQARVAERAAVDRERELSSFALAAEDTRAALRRVERERDDALERQRVAQATLEETEDRIRQRVAAGVKAQKEADDDLRARLAQYEVQMKASRHIFEEKERLEAEVERLQRDLRLYAQGAAAAAAPEHHQDRERQSVVVPVSRGPSAVSSVTSAASTSSRRLPRDPNGVETMLASHWGSSVTPAKAQRAVTSLQAGQQPSASTSSSSFLGAAFLPSPALNRLM
jgi:hypothetical protein